MTQAPPAPAGTPSDPPKTSGLAITSLILGVLGLVCGCFVVGVLPGLVGAALGVVALASLSKPGSVQKGKGLAVAGIATGGVSVVLAVLGLLLAVPNLHAARDNAKTVAEASNLKMVGMALMTHAVEYGDRFPQSPETLVDKNFSSEDAFISPFNTANNPTLQTKAVNGVTRFGDVIFLQPGQSLSQMRAPSQTPVAISAYTSTQNKRVVLFGDGHVEILDAADVPQVVQDHADMSDIDALSEPPSR